ncbi:MAG TPA: hypothetical protein ENI17_00235 [Pseudomonas xinjiangensis]|uniref:Uncharacterized protein n=2 Tax=root TaxID=1 RepID=A0A7V1BKL2_9GAMM|nr:hypothetical protein [Halopseudomonas xinjiangensis]HEC46049.1 hypothetical protein [Halopseudomonas xinjiangensis]
MISMVGAVALSIPAEARQMECLLMLMPNVPISRLVINTEAEKPIHSIIYDPASPTNIMHESFAHIAAEIHTPAIPANKYGVGAKGPASMYVTTRKPGEPQHRPLIYHVEWQEGTLQQVQSHVNDPRIEISGDWECEVKPNERAEKTGSV